MIRRPPSVLVAALIGASAALAAGCRPAAPAAADPTAPVVDPAADEPDWFEDVTDKVGLDFVHDAGPLGSYFMPEIIGSGGALFDFDGDGRLDILLLQNGGPKSSSKNRLYKQLRDGKFQDVSAGSGLDFAGYNMGVAIGDVNNDGKPDVLITQFGGVKLFLNLGDGKFQDVTKEAGLDAPGWSTSAAFFDYDRDGRPDLVIVRYLDYDPSVACPGRGAAVDYCNPNTFKGVSAVLYHNVTGSDGRPRFEDVTGPSGLGRLPGPGLGVICADFDGDGFPDIFIADDGKPNRLWINQHGDGTFKEEAVRRGVAYNGMGVAQAGMGVALGDVDGDGLEDLFVTHLGEETSALWMQGPRGLFRDRSGASGLTQPRWRGTGFGTALADFNLDGALDLAIVNGRVASGQPVAGASGLAPFWSAYVERNQLFMGDGKGRFRELSPGQATLCGTPNMGRGLAVGDVNNDGAPDLLVTTAGGRARLLLNRAPNRGHWLGVRALYPTPDRDAVGAVVTVRCGDRRWVRRADPCCGFLCSGDPRAYFGLGKAETVDAVEVQWPDGTRDEFPGGAVDRVMELRQRKGGK